jgi:hypothetical protein
LKKCITNFKSLIFYYSFVSIERNNIITVFDHLELDSLQSCKSRWIKSTCILPLLIWIPMGLCILTWEEAIKPAYGGRVYGYTVHRHPVVLEIMDGWSPGDINYCLKNVLIIKVQTIRILRSSMLPAIICCGFFFTAFFI